MRRCVAVDWSAPQFGAYGAGLQFDKHPGVQNSSVVPQYPNWEQHTLSGQVRFSAAAKGPHSARALQFDEQ